MDRSQNMGGDSELRCAISPIITHVYMYVLDMMYITMSGLEVLRLDSKIQVEARGRISKGNDVRGNVRAENKPRARRGTGLTPAEPMCLTKYRTRFR
jgi:hypothetical protein